MSEKAYKILDEATAKIVRMAIENPTIYYNKSQLARHAGVSRETVYDRLDALLDYGVLEEADVQMQTTHYKLNPDSKAADAISRLLYREDDFQ